MIKSANKMQIPSELPYIRKVSSEIEGFLKANKVNEEVIFDIRLCVEEAVRNAIVHGNKNNKDLLVDISYSLEGDKFSIAIEDRGSGFDHRKVPDPTEGENLLREGGRGVFIMHKFMDEIKYNDRGNKAFMVKFVNRRKEGNR